MNWRLEPRFLDGALGRLHVTEWIPRRPADGRPVVVALPPFAEEMNRSRRMFAMQAHQLAERGIGLVTFDPFGTGDSAGDFGRATWQIWCSDLLHVLNEVRARGSGRTGLIGLRSGALLAASIEVPRQLAPVSLVLWAPITDGRMILRQLMRLHAAASMASAGGGAEATADLQRRLAAGESVEIAGYTVSAEMARTLSELSLSTLPRLTPARVHWVDVIAGPDEQLSPAAARGVAELQRAGLAVAAHVVADEPFWSLPEITVAPRLASRTTDLLASDLSHVH